MTARLRLVGVTLHPHFMIDDGENLTPLSVDPLSVPAAVWPNVVEWFAETTAAMRAEVEGTTDIDANPPGIPDDAFGCKDCGRVVVPDVEHRCRY